MRVMYRLSLVINEIYNKYLPKAIKAGVTLNLDFPDPTIRVNSPSKVKKTLEEHVPKAILRVSSASAVGARKKPKGEVMISVSKTGVEIRDTGTTLSPSAVKLLSSEHVDVKSRVGFGTRIMIYFTPRKQRERGDS